MGGAATPLRFGLVLAAAGSLLAAPVLVLPGVALILLTAGCATWVRLAALGVTARRAGLPARVSEGERFEIVIDGISGWLPLLARVEDPAAAAPRRLRVVRPRSPFTVRLEGALPRRGRHQLGAPALVLADPLGIADAAVPAGDPASILVLPRIEPLGGHADERGPAIGRRRGGLGELTAAAGRESPSDPEVDGIRPYRPGTKATRIYWPALARGAGLAERHIAAAGDAAPLVALDPSRAASDDDLDRAVRAAASLVAHLVRLGGCGLLIGGTPRRITVGRDPRELTGALAALALVEATDRPPRLAPGDLRSNVIWVAASPAPAPAGVARGFVVVPRQLPGVPVTFTVAGCSGHALARGEAARWAA
jgi:uncharacterized protein (DUF58 family)